LVEAIGDLPCICHESGSGVLRSVAILQCGDEQHRSIVNLLDLRDFSGAVQYKGQYSTKAMFQFEA
jgi:hypothetical protein